MTINPNDPAQLEAFLREQTKRKREWDKLDFKQAWLKDIPGRRKPEIDQRAKMELIKDINAMANTFSLDFDDYGFLVLGVSRNEGKVTIGLAPKVGRFRVETRLWSRVQQRGSMLIQGTG